jgi:hypothetical protein
MPRTRRIALLVALGLTASLGLAGCGKAQLSVAAYVGQHRYTERQIDRFAKEARDAGRTEAFADVRTFGVSTLVLNDLAHRAVARLGLAVGPADYAGAAESLHLPESATFARLSAEFEAAANAIQTNVQPVRPTDADLREIYDAGIARGELAPNAKFSDVADDLRSNTRVPVVLAVRNVLRDEAAKVKVVVNPRYTPLVASVGGIPLEVSIGSGVVKDLPVSVAPAPEPDQAPAN